jgi:hypothetical protein
MSTNPIELIRSLVHELYMDRGEDKFTADICHKIEDELLPLAADIQTLRGTLADIALSEDMTLEVAKNKAARMYRETA